MTEQRVADPLAEAAVADIRSGMLVGLGTGRTASRGVVALAERMRTENLELRCVSTSHATETLARFHGLPVMDFALVERVDYLFDGADEVDPNMNMLKGSGGAMTRERIVAWAAERRVYMVDESKLVSRLGERTTLPIAVLAYGLAAVRAEMRNLGLNGVCRRTIKGELFLTDNGNLIIDVAMGEQDLSELAASLNDVPGVIDHGLFLTEADEILIERDSGTIEKRVREQ
ncbi:MAG: ribose-5-phosphate isomerase RpiA [Phycisphaerales bacterium]|nr:ribose-5-phosphate isomerase RpiA [Phycisphaerales bacterium]